LEKLRHPKGLAAGVGISGMHERLGIIGGELKIESDRHGTQFAATIPVEFSEMSRVQVTASVTQHLSAANPDRSSSK